MPKRRGPQPTSPGLAMSYVPDARIVDGDAITPRHNTGMPPPDPEMLKEGSTLQANQIYYRKIIQQWLHKGDIPRWTDKVSDLSMQQGRGSPFFFDKNCTPGSTKYKAPWTLKIPSDALQIPGSRFLEDLSVQIAASGPNDLEYEVARCPLWAAMQLMQHHDFLERGLPAKEVVLAFATGTLKSGAFNGPFHRVVDYPEDTLEQPEQSEEEVESLYTLDYED